MTKQNDELVGIICQELRGVAVSDFRRMQVPVADGCIQTYPLERIRKFIDSLRGFRK